MIPSCPTCKKKGVRSERYDAYGCVDCNVWLERGCGDMECEFCSDRPDKPKEDANDSL